ncbi:MAG: antibiotic biosynthesis monooxygenase [Polaromonas sp.]|uniref:antibiotic biosynthesis monooxygenase n=1 Tax=Polaromonas sp. TaxID=1869339 RepID=UPI001856B6A1|nr:antibiotic biosynthesis monooxygenase [Polaromonas sp.]MBA3595250.1 antibiotic biosynthesis monooxygenase [Polaromonas sp.]
MTTESLHSASTSVFRVDKFVVPSQSMGAFVERVRQVQQTLCSLPGCLQKHVLTQTGDSSEFDVVTVVEWASADALAAGQAVVLKQLASEAFDQQAFRKKLGVRGDSGLYSKA